MTARAWILTVHTETWDACPIAREMPLLRYMCGQLEIGEKTLKRHWQIYLELTSPIRVAQLKKMLGDDSIHCERRMGSREQARAYCMKKETRVEGTTFEIGSWETGGQGARTDLIALRDMVLEGHDDLEIMDKLPGEYIRFYKAIDRIREKKLEIVSRRFRELEVTVIIGEAGMGKTRSIWDKYGYDGAIYTISSYGEKLWWDGYTGQDVLLIDEFYGGIKYNELLQILDGYPLHLQIKGGHTWANWTKVYITSNDEPGTWYRLKGLTPALKRRLHKVENLKIEEISDEEI